MSDQTVAVEIILRYDLTLEDCPEHEVEPTTIENIKTLLRSPDCALIGVPGSSMKGRPIIIVNVQPK